MAFRFKAVVSYDGTDYCGWQIQRHELPPGHVSPTHCMNDKSESMQGSCLSDRSAKISEHKLAASSGVSGKKLRIEGVDSCKGMPSAAITHQMKPSIQGTLERRLEGIYSSLSKQYRNNGISEKNSKKISAKQKDGLQKLNGVNSRVTHAIFAAGRTDAGVHAVGQVFQFDCPMVIFHEAVMISGALVQAGESYTKTTCDSVANLFWERFQNGLPGSIRVISVSAIGMMDSFDISTEYDKNDSTIGQVTSAKGELESSPTPITSSPFHVRNSCTKKRYQYTICEGAAPPMTTRFCYSLPGASLALARNIKQGMVPTNSSQGVSQLLSTVECNPNHTTEAMNCPFLLDIDKMQEASNEFLVGLRDFRAFGVMEEGDNRGTERNMSLLKIIRDTNPDPVFNDNITNNITSSSANGISYVKIVAECDRFLYNMMRMISGTLVDVGLGRLSPKDVGCLLDAKQRGGKLHNKHIRVMKAPPQGLCLVKVYYDKD